jgi:hypothetical protein
MEEKKQTPTDSLRDIKQIMERSSRFISLSGFSGIAAGVCALTGLYYTVQYINCPEISKCLFERLRTESGNVIENELYRVALLTFCSAFILSFFFTWLRSKKTAIPLWGPVAKRLMWHVAVPMIAGGLFIFRMIQLQQYELVAPGCLLFYGLALINASKFTLQEVRYLGYTEIILGLLNSWFIDYGLQFLAVGFGILHIFYGIIMWWKYERKGKLL